MFFVVYAFQHEVVFIDGESILYVVIITLTLIILLMKANKVSVALLIVFVIYISFRYLLGAFDLFLLSLYKNDAWMYESYSWAKAEDINLWLRYAVVCTILFGTGLIIGTRINHNALNTENKLREKPINISAKHFLLIYILFATITMVDFHNYGYGAISGHEGNPFLTLYGIINIEPLLYISLMIIIARWNVFLESEKKIYLFIIVSCVVLRMSTGSRSSLYGVAIATIYFLSIFRGDLVIRYKHIFALIGLIILSILFYPIGKAFKEIAKYSSGITLSFSYITERFSFVEVLTAFLEQWRVFSIEIIDRLSAMTAQLKIITGQQVIPVEDHINLINIFKRTINDLVPGDVFVVEIPTQALFNTIYQGMVPQDTIYGGELYSLFGVFYMLFGYGAAFIALFFSSIAIGYLWKKLYASHTSFKPIFLGLYIVTFEDLLNNTLMEGWLVTSIKRTLTLLLIVLILNAIRSITEAFLLPTGSLAKNPPPNLLKP